MVNLARAAWLQAMLAHRQVTDKQSRALYQAACEATKTTYRERAYEDFVSEAADAINPLGLEFRRMIDQSTGKSMLVLVNTKSDDIAQLATNYTAQEIALLKIIVEIIFTAPDEAYSVPTIEVLREATKMKPQMSKKAAEELINSLIRHGWIHRSRSGRLSLTVRSILELQAYLKQEFPDYVLECTICKDIVTKGFACSTSECDVRVHQACLPQLGGRRSNASGATRTCPGCKDEFKPAPVGEDSAGSRRRPAPARRRGGNAEEDEDEEEDIDASTPTQGRSSARNAASSRKRSSAGGAGKRAKRTRRRREEESEDEEEEDHSNANSDYDEEDDDEEEEEGEEEEEATQAPRNAGRTSSSAGRQRAQPRRRSSTNSRRNSGVRIAGGGFFDDEAGSDGDRGEDDEEDDEEAEDEDDED